MEQENNISEPSNDSKSTDEAVFCVPLEPAPVPVVTVTSKTSTLSAPIVALDYTKPDWSGTPPFDSGESELDAEGFCSHYYLEVIKNGVIVEKLKITKEFTSFGRLNTCDVLCEHPSLSRYHSVLQYSNGSNEKYPKGLYLIDLGSTHGTFINKTKLEPHKYTRVEVESIIKFGLSTRLYLLHGPKPEVIGDTDLKISLTHEQMKKIKERHDQIALKLRVRKELAEEEEESEWKKKAKGKGIDWGLSEEGKDEATEDVQNEDDYKNPFAEDLNQVDESYYSADPKKTLKQYFDRENDELEYEMEELAVGKYKCRIRLPILNDFGEYMYAECQYDGKKKECQAQCALEACRILNAQGVLKPRAGGQESAKRKKQKNWQSDDYYDSDEDTYLDRTGDIEKKRLKRMEACNESGTSSSSKDKVHTFESIKEDLKRLYNEKLEIETKLNKCKDVFKAVNNDDVDEYINSLKVCEIDTITRAKFKRRLVELGNQVIKFEKLLVIAKPADFDLEKWKVDLDKDANNMLTSETKQVDLVKKELRKEEVEIVKSLKSEHKEEDSSNSKSKSKTQHSSEIINETLNKEATINVNSSKKEEVKLPRLKLEKRLESEVGMETPYEDNKDYAVWVPPKDQTGDGKTKLNEKYGY